MNFSKCPQCNNKQGFFHVLLINSHNDRKCKGCGCSLAFSFKHSLIVLLSSAALMGLALLFKAELKEVSILSIGVIFIFMLIIFAKFVPLVER